MLLEIAYKSEVKYDLKYSNSSREIFETFVTSNVKVELHEMVGIRNAGIAMNIAI